MSLNFKKSVCDDCHDLMSPNISDITVIAAKGVVCCIIYDVNKSDAIPFLENSVLNDRGFGHSFYEIWSWKINKDVQSL